MDKQKSASIKKVYVLMRYGIDDVEVVGVFSSMAKAKEAMNEIVENDKFYMYATDCLRIDTFELNGRRIKG